ncbi:hypothetical protein [Peribacillus huizhouensis]|uniref:Uncharacterized protein n=1 Tax=Peribacillus huizhouensis TaxID=1501239 RepID=A0ABR6CR70_9BACI|nr:hypothetical protein [Peribacillus huizhouensis]MBA9027533.1 hypothetical protein [Peribacillus huizhouensis]
MAVYQRLLRLPNVTKGVSDSFVIRSSEYAIQGTLDPPTPYLKNRETGHTKIDESKLTFDFSAQKKAPPLR